MSDKIKHLYAENQDTFTSCVVSVGDNFVDTVEQNNLCTVCFLTYFHSFVVDAILAEAPERSNEILMGMLTVASRILKEPVIFTNAPPQTTNMMDAVFDAFADQMTTKPKGKLN